MNSCEGGTTSCSAVSCKDDLQPPPTNKDGLGPGAALLTGRPALLHAYSRGGNIWGRIHGRTSS
jgi:hypothetical protein